MKFTITIKRLPHIGIEVVVSDADGVTLQHCICGDDADACSMMYSMTQHLINKVEVPK